MSKVKVRCTSCGKWFQSANAKNTICPDCTQKAKKAKQAAKDAPVVEAKVAANKPLPAPPKPKQEKSGTSQWLDTVSDVKVGQPDQPSRPKLPAPPPRDTRGGSGTVREERESGTTAIGGASAESFYREREHNGNTRTPGTYRPNENRPAPYRVGGGEGLPAKPRQPMGNRGPRPDGDRGDRGNRGPYRGGKPAGHSKVKTPKPPPPPKPKREKIPPPLPFVPTPEQITQVQTRYLELAQPAEFDGIRTQIAQELSIPKKAVKQIVKELRESQQIPSWWDNETYKGSEEDLARIRELYEPALPLPHIGVHKKIAEQLSLKPVDVYQAIKAIRMEMHLPRYNDPALHGIELKPRSPRKRSEESQETQEVQEVQEVQEATLVPTDDVSTTDAAAVVASSDNNTEASPSVTGNATSSESTQASDVQTTDETSTTPVATTDISTTDTAAVIDATEA